MKRLRRSRTICFNQNIAGREKGGIHVRVTVQQAAKRLLSQDHILILSHKSPDGDTLGSAYALLYALRACGKEAHVLCSDPVPPQFAYLVDEEPTASFEPSFITAVDVASRELLGSALSDYAVRVDLCIDHHRTNGDYAKETLVDDKAAATCEILYAVIAAMGASFTARIASCLYTGIATDSGCFKYPNSTAHTHRIAAELIEAGADYARINRELFDTKSKARVAIEKQVLDTLSFAEDGQIAWVCITQEMLRETGARESELDGLAALPRMIEGVEIGITLREQQNGSYKVSVRTAQKADASAICAEFGGGGHLRAAGCRFTCPYEEALEKLLSAAKRAL